LSWRLSTLHGSPLHIADGWAAMHTASGGIHLLLILAVVALVIHLMRGRSAV